MGLKVMVYIHTLSKIRPADEDAYKIVIELDNLVAGIYLIPVENSNWKFQM